jgi:uncharacterized protein YwqG
MLTREELETALVEAGLGRIATPLADLSEPCVLVTTHTHPDETMPVGRSRIGGWPDLPASIDWPYWRDKPLGFLAQISLADLTSFECCQVLPKSGILWFFYDSEQSTGGFDPEDRGSWRVLYADAKEAELRHQTVPGLPEHAIYRPCTLTFHDFLSIPGPEHLSVVPLKLTLEELEEIEEIDSDLHEMIESDSIQQHFEPHHQLFGHPKEIQGEMQTECQFASNGYYCGDASQSQNPPPEILNWAKNWRLLFQLDTDDDRQSGKPGMMWGDCGRLYFWIRQQDLAMERFENAWMVLQCS